jgi:oligosaccharide translocation protein RFT1
VPGLNFFFTHADVDAYNYILGMLSIAFLFLAWAFSSLFGPIGFIAANCVNFAFRIVHNFYVIETRRQNLKLNLVSML